MTGVLVVSDTHAVSAASLPAALFTLAERADAIVHAGDIASLDVLHVLRQFAPLTAVSGNVDPADVTAVIPQTCTVTVDGVRIGILHDAGRRDGRHERLLGQFPDCAAIVYGHSHEPEIIEAAPGRWIVNPGSAMQRRRAPFHSVAWLTVSAGGVESVELVDLDSVQV